MHVSVHHCSHCTQQASSQCLLHTFPGYTYLPLPALHAVLLGKGTLIDTCVSPKQGVSLLFHVVSLLIIHFCQMCGVRSTATASCFSSLQHSWMSSS